MLEIRYWILVLRTGYWMLEVGQRPVLFCPVCPLCLLPYPFSPILLPTSNLQSLISNLQPPTSNSQFDIEQAFVV
jgi:hypothetical protein